MATSFGEDNKADLGILLVHGIGQQKQRDTLVAFGEPLKQWLSAWLKKADDAPDDAGVEFALRIQSVSAQAALDVLTEHQAHPVRRIRYAVERARAALAAGPQAGAEKPSRVELAINGWRRLRQHFSSNPLSASH